MNWSNQYIEVCLEGTSSPFRLLNQKDKEIIDKHHIIKSFKKKEAIAGASDKLKGLIYLVSGKMKVYRTGLGEREQIVKMGKPHDFLGLRALLTDTVFGFEAEAIDDSVVCIIEKGNLLRIIKKSPEMALRLLKIVAEENDHAHLRLIDLTQKHVRSRIADTLLLLAETYGTGTDGKTLKVNLSREDIAHLSNMTTSNGIRTLSALSREGIISMQGRRIILSDIKELQEISEHP